MSTSLRRWGPLTAILVAVAAIAGLTLTAPDATTEQATGEGTATSVVDPAVADRLPITYARAEADGTVADHEWPETCDTERGTVAIPTIYAPPCVPAYEGDNGGATGVGVTADTVTLVRYEAAPNGDLSALLAGAQDPVEVQAETQARYVEMFEGLFETYGRDVEIVTFQATGADEVTARADAVAVAEEIRPFASIGGPGLTQAYAEELAARGVMCIGCGISAPDSTIQELAPYMWGNSATPEQYLQILGTYITDRLMGDPAEFAGSEELREKERVFGVVHFEQDPPVFGEVNAEVAERGEERGYETRLRESYVFDIPKLPERAATIIAKMKDAGVTTIMFLGDPIMPIYLTGEATKQDYFPEWIVTGTVLTDTSVLARRYDQQQWAHAFGLSQLAARIPREEGDSWRLHEWWYGEPPAAVKTSGLILPPISLVMAGIHLAGPELTPETFRAALFSLPPAGGGPTTPRVSYGEQAGFEAPDYLGVDDMTEIWWDADAVEVDEQGVEATGAYRYVDGGRRLRVGEVPTTPPDVFSEEGSVILYDERPAEDVAPDYDPPPGAPASG